MAQRALATQQPSITFHLAYKYSYANFYAPMRTSIHTSMHTSMHASLLISMHTSMHTSTHEKVSASTLYSVALCRLLQVLPWLLLRHLQVVN